MFRVLSLLTFLWSASSYAIANLKFDEAFYQFDGGALFPNGESQGLSLSGFVFPELLMGPIELSGQGTRLNEFDEPYGHTGWGRYSMELGPDTAFMHQQAGLEIIGESPPESQDTGYVSFLVSMTFTVLADDAWLNTVLLGGSGYGAIDLYDLTEQTLLNTLNSSGNNHPAYSMNAYLEKNHHYRFTALLQNQAYGDGQAVEAMTLFGNARITIPAPTLSWLLLGGLLLSLINTKRVTLPKMQTAQPRELTGR